MRKVGRNSVPFFIAIVGLAVLGTGLGVAAEGSGPRVDAVSGTFTSSQIPGTVRTRQCIGTDGAAYLEVEETDLGTVTSNNAQVSGTIETHVPDLLVNLKTGAGAATGTITLRDQTGRRKAFGQIEEVIDGTAIKGLIDLQFSGGGRFIANFSSHVDLATNTVNGEFGSPNAAVMADLAVLRVGGCPERANSTK